MVQPSHQDTKQNVVKSQVKEISSSSSTAMVKPVVQVSSDKSSTILVKPLHHDKKINVVKP